MDYYTVEECCEILDSKRKPVTASKRIKGIYPYYGANGIQDYVNNFIFDDELVLVAEDGGNFGSKTKPIAYKVSGKCWINNHAHVLKPKEFINIDYLLYALMFYDTSSLITGSTRMKLNKSQLSLMKIPSIPLKEQIKISTQLNSLTKCIILKKENLKYLDELIKSRFNEMFGDPILNDLNWNKERLQNLTDVRDGTHDSPKYYPAGYPFVTSKNLVDGKIDFSTCNFICKEDYEKINKRSKVDDSDILMPMIGTVGGAVLVKKDRDFAIKNVALVKIYEDSKIQRNFLLCILNSDQMNSYFDNFKKGGTQKFLSLGNIRELPIIIPPFNLQNEFTDFVNLVDKSKLIIEKQIKELQELFDSKMDQYFG